jgi:Rv0078B-related antitoxin
MEPTRELAEELDAARREAAEQMTIGQRLLAGPDLHDLGLMMMRAGIRMDNPDIDHQSVERMVLERLQEARRF